MSEAMWGQTIQITASRLLVVEGKDEKLFFEALIQHIGLEDIQILDIGGKTRLRSALKALSSSPGFHKVNSLGIIRDADENSEGARQSVRDALQHAGLPDPDSSNNANPRVSILILPPDEKQGALEDLCLKSVGRDPVMKCVDDYFRCIGRHLSDLNQRDLSKAKIQVFLAFKAPGKRLGEATQAGCWSWNNEAFEKVKDFLHRL
jgi:hypothetical protein